MNLKRKMVKAGALLLCLAMLVPFAGCRSDELDISVGKPSSPVGTLENPSSLSSVLDDISKSEPSPETPTPSGDATPTPSDDLPTPSDEPTPTPTLTPEPTPTPTPSDDKIVAVTGVSLDKKELSLLVGGTATLNATVFPEDATNNRVSFASSNSSILSVKDGFVTALAEGTAKVIVTTVDGIYKAECTVTVRDLPATASRYDENGLPNYTPVFEDGVTYVDFNAKNVLHMFTHCLVDYTDQKEREEYYKDCITADEFKMILDEVYKNGYVLIDIDYMYDYAYVGNKLTATVKKTIKVPEGKKPLIISVDNVCYPVGEHGMGRADRLEVKNGKLFTYTKLKDGSDFYSDDNEVFPILENFIAEHPDFSFSGAKCVVAPSAAEGLFGWDTTAGAKNREENIKQAKIIANWFVDNGYAIACHSYYHGNFQTMSEAKIRADIGLWNEEAAPILGRTHVFIYPYGAFTIKNSRNSEVMSEFGFAVFCATSMNGINWDNFPLAGNAYNERIILASKLFVTYKDNAVLNKLFDPYKIYDNSVHTVKLYALTVENDSMELKVGDSTEIESSVKGLYATLVYTVDKEGLTVDENGRITASKAGVYTVTVSVKGSDVKASCKVTVS